MKNLRFFVTISIVISYSSLNAQWLQTNGPSSGSIVQCFAVNGTSIFAGTEQNGVFLSTNNGTSWMTVNTGLTDTSVTAFAISGTNFFAGTYYGSIFLSTNNGTNWTSVNTGLGTVWVLMVSPNGTGGTNLFAGTNGGGVLLSTDNGTSWAAVNSGLTNTYVHALAVSPDSSGNLFAGTFGGGVFRSTDNGTSWTDANVGLMDGYVYAFAVSGTNLFAAGTNGGGVFLSTNNGTNWTTMNTGLTNTYVQAFSVTGTNLFAGTNYGGVFLSTNNGIGWNEASTGLPPNTAVLALAVSGTDLFAGTFNHGVWKRTLSELLPVELTSFTATTNGKEVTLNWSTATELNNQGFEVQCKVVEGDFAAVGFIKGEGTTTNQKEYSYVDKNLAVGKYFYRLKQLDFSGVYDYSNTIEVEVKSLDNFALEQNYPNPFNPSTKISWQSPVGSWQTLKIYDLLGNEVATLVDEYKPAGSYEVEFSAGNLPSGIYFYKLQASKYIKTKKLVLLK